MDCINGGESDIRYSRAVSCGRCDGFGFDTRKELMVCRQCGGRGQYTQRHGTMVIQTTCHACSGSGKENPAHCFACGGRGSVEEEISTKIKIPKGIRHGQKIRLSRAGHTVEVMSPPGDVYLEVMSKNSYKEFTRKENNIYSSVKIPFTTATLGGEIKVNTIDGVWVLRVPKSCQPGSTLMISDAGVETHTGEKGNHYVEVNIEIPGTLTPDQESALKTYMGLL